MAQKSTKPPKLKPRHKHVAELEAQGLNVSDISRRLEIDRKTVQRYRKVPGYVEYMEEATDAAIQARRDAAFESYRQFEMKVIEAASDLVDTLIQHAQGGTEERPVGVREQQAAIKEVLNRASVAVKDLGTAEGDGDGKANGDTEGPDEVPEDRTSGPGAAGDGPAGALRVLGAGH